MGMRVLPPGAQPVIMHSASACAPVACGAVTPPGRRIPNHPVYANVPNGTPRGPKEAMMVRQGAASVGAPVAAQGLVTQDGSPSQEFVQQAGHFYGYVDALQKQGRRKPRDGTRAGSQDIRRMEANAARGVFDGTVENIWDG